MKRQNAPVHRMDYELDPGNTHLLNNLAKLLILQKEHDSARQILEGTDQKRPQVIQLAKANLDEIKRQEKLSEDMKKEL